MKKDSFYIKSLVFGTIILFIGAAIVPSISGHNNKISNQSTMEIPTSFPLSAGYVNAFWKFNGKTFESA